MINPFRESIVADPWRALPSDVLTIHEDVYHACLDGIEQVRNRKRTSSLLIHGEAGSGKTHLLSRLRAQLSLRYPTATDRHEALYVWVRLQTSPSMIWRAVRRTLVNDWFRPIDNSRCQFDRILFHRLAEYRVAEGDLEPWYEYMLGEDPQGLTELIDRIAEKLDLDRNTHVAFQHLAFGKHRRDLRAWLCGDSLPESALERMELNQDDGTDEEREEESRRVVLMLCHLAGNELPIVLSFDQVEALELNPGDAGAMFAFGQLVSTLHDSTTNVLIVSTVQSAFSQRLIDQSREADRDRMRSLGAFTITPLNREEARQVIQARLQSIPNDLSEIQAENRYWPLSQKDVDALFASGSVTPRKLLARCAEKFDLLPERTADAPLAELNQPESHLATPRDVQLPETSDPPPPSPSAEEALFNFLNESWQSTFDEKRQHNTPDQSESILRHALPSAVKLIDQDVKFVEDEKLPDVSLILESPVGRIGMSVCTQSNMNSLSARLKRLSQQIDLRRADRFVIIRDQRVPLSKTAKKAKEHLAALEDKGAVIVFPSVEIWAALDALRALLSDAKSGDLSCRGETVSPATLEEWFAQHLPGELQDFINETCVAPSGLGPQGNVTLMEALHALLAQNPVVEVDFAADRLGCSVEDLLELITQHPDLFGLAGQPPTALFRVTSTEN